VETTTYTPRTTVFIPPSTYPLRAVRWIILLVVAGLYLPPIRAQAPDPLATKGLDFWLGFMQNAYGAQELRVHIASQNGTTGTVTIPRTGWTTSFSVGANGVSTVIVPISNEHTGSELISDKAVRVQALDSVTVSLSSFQSFTSDAAQVMPIEALGTQYRAQGYRGLPGFSDFYKSELLVVATADDTELEITPSVNTSGGRPAGVPFIVTLDAGQTFQVQSALAALDITGSTVRATTNSGSCRPFAVFSGSMCANVPVTCPACDHIVEQMVPTAKWGRNFHTVPMQGASSYTFRILADQNNTAVTIDGGAPVMLNAGQTHQVNGATQPVCITADKPISAVQLMEGFNCALAGDPSMIELTPDERMTTHAVFFSPGSAQISQHSVGVIMATTAIGQLALDGSPVSAALFQPFAACSGFSHAKVPVTAGTHRLSSAQGFVACALGVGTGESYAYTLNSKAVPGPTADSLICVSAPVVLNTPQPIVNAEWTAASSPGTVIGTGPSYALTPTVNDSYTVTGEAPGSGCPITFTYHVGLSVQPALTLTANNLAAATVCQFGAVQLNVTPPPDPAWFDISWTPVGNLSDPTIPDPLAYPQANTWFRIDVISPMGCGSVSDSILVNVLPNTLLAVHASVNDNAICTGATVQLAAQAEQVIANDALNGQAGALWSLVNGGSVANTCGAISGDALYFNGSGVREARTSALNVVNGGMVDFALKIANGAAPCDNAEPGEDVVLEYSLNGGTTWSVIPLAVFSESAYPLFTPLTIAIPAAAQSAATLFRWRQLVHSGPGQDNWAIDDVVITRNNTAGLNFLWSPITGLSAPTAANTAAAPTTTTWFSVTASTASGCSAQDSVQVNVQPAFQVTASNDTTACGAGGVQLGATPNSGQGITWSWSPSNGTLNNTLIEAPVASPTTTTTYTVTATSNIGCTASDAVTVTMAALNGVTVSSTDTSLCNNESASLSAVPSGTNACSYAWTPSTGLNNALIANPTATPSTTTTYTCTVTELLSGCQRSASITINVNGPYTVDAPANDTLCSTVGFQLDVQHNIPAPFSITWSNGQFLNNNSIATPTIAADTTATYVVTVTDANGCSSMDSTTIVAMWDDLITPVNASACAGTPVLLDAGYPGCTYLWNTNATTQTIVTATAGPFTAQITDAQGCVTTKSFFVTFNPVPTVNLGPDLSLCGASGQLLNANSPGNGFLWSTGQTTQQITVTQSALYSVLVTSPQGCQSGDAINVVFNALPADPLQDITTCVSNAVTLNAGNAGSTYAWSTGATTQTITPASSGLYSVLVTNPQNCTTTFDANVIIMPMINVDLGNDTTLCAGQPLLLDAGNPGAIIQWSNGATTQTISPSQSGVFSATASNGYCIGSDAITVTFTPSPSDPLQDVTICVDQPVTLDAGNVGCTYLWSTGATTQSINAPISGTYSVIVSNSIGCSITADAVVTLIGFPVVDLGPDSALCDGDVLTLDAGNPGALYAWSNGSTAQTLTVTNSGMYVVTVSNGFCTSTGAVIATFNPLPTRLLERKFHTCLDDAPGYVVIDAGNEGGEYEWSNGESTQIIMASAYGWYYVQVTNIHECVTRDSAEVIEFCPPTIHVPNTFTPNGDGTNDIWQPSGKGIGEYSVQVFDRYGVVIFQSNDPNVGWDGTMHGKYVMNDVYIWRMEYRFVEDETGTEGFLHKELGHVTVLR
jgi:gliding motility-associated-like protein